jgi:hypothetical protein
MDEEIKKVGMKRFEDGGGKSSFLNPDEDHSSTSLDSK